MNTIISLSNANWNKAHIGKLASKDRRITAIIGKSLNHKNQNTTAIYARLDLDPVRDSVNTATSAMLTAGGLTKPGEIVQFKKKK